MNSIVNQHSCRLPVSLMLFLLALLFFSVSTSVTALPMIQYYNHDTGPTISPAALALPMNPGPYNHHPGAPISLPTVNQQPGPDAMASPIGNALPALEELDLPEEELIPRFAGCWTLMVRECCSSNVTSFEPLIGGK